MERDRTTQVRGLGAETNAKEIVPSQLRGPTSPSTRDGSMTHFEGVARSMIEQFGKAGVRAPLQPVLQPSLKNQHPKPLAQSAASKLPTLQEQGFKMNGSNGIQRPSPDFADYAIKTPKQPLIESPTNGAGFGTPSPPLDRNTQMDGDPDGGAIQIDAELDVASGNKNISPNDKKRKRDENEEDSREWDRVVKRKIEDESDRIDAEENKSESSNRELYALFHDLQAMQADFKLSIAAPELVVVGGQSDASFVEGLLGFQFNIVDSGIGTRRPLIIQMINNPEKVTPSCRFRREAPSAEADVDDLEGETPVDELAEQIIKRTEAKAGVSKDRVSDVPIILRVEYKHCANLTIYDTPGFRLSGNQQLAEEITKMVTGLMKPANRIIVCLEQATMEWANSNSRPFVAQVDPYFHRTIFVMTKFDNRVKELRSAEEANAYLAGENLPPNNRPFFISMPFRRNLSNANRFKDHIKECYLDDFKSLSLSRFDQARFGSQVGFFRLKKFLENLLHKKYVESTGPTLQILETMYEDSVRELEQLRVELQNTDVKVQMAKVQNYVSAFCSTVEKLLDGTTYCDAAEWGQTISEEREASGVQSWPNETMKKLSQDVINANLKLSGHAQITRLLTEFQMSIHAVEFPETPLAEVVSVLCGSQRTNLPSIENAAVALVQKKAMEQFMPLVSIGLKRYAYLTRRVVDIAFAEISKQHRSSVGMIGQYEGFKRELKSVFDNFVGSVCSTCEERLHHIFRSYVQFIDGNLLSGMQSAATDSSLNPSFEETRKRVLAAVESELPVGLNAISRSQMFTEEGANVIRQFAAKLWSGIRFMMAKTASCSLNYDFFQPVFEGLAITIEKHFASLDESKFDKMFQTGVAQLKHRLSTLEDQVQRLQHNRDRFREVVRKLEERTSTDY